MSQLYTLDIKNAYNVNFRAPAILGAGLNNAIVQAKLDYETAQMLEDVTGIHASVLPLLPAGTPADASQLVYVKFKVGTNQSRIVAMDWISSISAPLSSQSVTVVVANCSPANRSVLANALIQNGFTEFTFQ